MLPDTNLNTATAMACAAMTLAIFSRHIQQSCFSMGHNKRRSSTQREPALEFTDFERKEFSKGFSNFLRGSLDGDACYNAGRGDAA